MTKKEHQRGGGTRVPADQNLGSGKGKSGLPPSQTPMENATSVEID